MRLLEEQAARMIQETDVVLSDYGQWFESPEGRQATPGAVARTPADRRDASPVRLFGFASLASTAVFATTRNADPGSEVVQIPATALKSTPLHRRAFCWPTRWKEDLCGQQADRRTQRRLHWRRGGARRLRLSHDVFIRTWICRPTPVSGCFEMTVSNSTSYLGATKHHLTNRPRLESPCPSWSKVKN